MNTEQIRNMSLSELINMGPFECECGKTHSVGTRRCIIESGAIRKLPALLAECGSKKPFILSGHDTFAAAGEKVTGVLKESVFELCVPEVSCDAYRALCGQCGNAL